MSMLKHIAPALVVATLSLGARAEPFSFRGLSLGSPLTDLRRMRFPEASAARIICTHDPEAADLRPSPDFEAQPDEVKAGVMVCGAFNFGRMFGSSPSSLPPEWIPAKVQVARVEVSPTYWYVPADPASAEQPKLYRISMRTNSDYWNETKDAFIRRYGTPERVEKMPYSGYRGTRLDNEKVVWRSDDTTIALIKRSQLPNQTMIVYEHDRLMPAGAKLGNAEGSAVPAGEPARAATPRAPG